MRMGGEKWPGQWQRLASVVKDKARQARDIGEAGGHHMGSGRVTSVKPCDRMELSTTLEKGMLMTFRTRH